MRQQHLEEGTDREGHRRISHPGRVAGNIMDKVAFLDIASNYRRKVNDEWEDDTQAGTASPCSARTVTAPPNWP